MAAAIQNLDLQLAALARFVGLVENRPRTCYCGEPTIGTRCALGCGEYHCAGHVDQCFDRATCPSCKQDAPVIEFDNTCGLCGHDMGKCADCDGAGHVEYQTRGTIEAGPGYAFGECDTCNGSGVRS